MTRRELHLTNILRSRGVAVIISLAGVWMAWSALVSGRVPDWPAGNTIALPSPSTWFGAMPEMSFVANIAVLAGVSAMMIFLNRQFNLLRTMSIFFVAFFMFATCATPGVAGVLSGSSILALAVMVCVWLMFSIYAERVSSRRVFLTFAVLSAGALLDYAFLLYVPVFIAGLGQMKLFRFKKLLAMLIGLVTPLWIVYGLGLAPWPRMPHFFWTPPTLVPTLPGGLPFVVTVGVTLMLGFFLGLLNLFRIFGFNARSRAYNGLLTLVSVATGIFAIVNFTHLQFYVTLLNASVAFQVGFFFRYTASRRGYILILSLLAIYAGLYIWQISD